MSKKKEEKKEQVKFDLNKSLSKVNRYLKQGFIEYLSDKKVTSQKQFNKYYNDYKELR